jgi:hypothetical protein
LATPGAPDPGAHCTAFEAAPIKVSPHEAYCAWSITSNIALSEWGRYLGDATLTAAILDRLAMHAIRIDIAGPSFRQHVAKSRAERAPAT